MVELIAGSIIHNPSGSGVMNRYVDEMNMIDRMINGDLRLMDRIKNVNCTL